MTTLIPKYTQVNTSNRTIAQKFAEIISVKDFGAVGDANPITGVGTDDTAAIQAAIYAISSGNDQQRSVFFPDGTYRITSTITLPEGVELYGNGAWKAKIHYVGAGVAIQWANGGTYDFPQIVRDLTLYSAGTYCIDTATTSGGIIRDVWFGGPGGISISGTADLMIADNFFDGTSNGVVFTAASLCNNIDISRNQFTGNAYGITLKNAREVRINGNAFRGDSSHNIHILCVSGDNILTGIIINANTFYTAPNTGAVGSLLMNLQGSALTNFTISNNNFDGCRAQGIYCASGSVVGVNIIGNIFSNIGSDVLYFVSVGENVAIKNNIFSTDIAGKALNWNTTGVCTFTNNEVFAANSSAQVGLNGAAVDVQQSALFVARGNTITSTDVTYGISIRSTVTVENANDNIISGATIAEYNIANSIWSGVKLTGPIHPGTFGAGTQPNGIWGASGVPSDTWGINGDWYMRTDTPSVGNQRLYAKSGGTWTGIL